MRSWYVCNYECDLFIGHLTFECETLNIEELRKLILQLMWNKFNKGLRYLTLVSIFKLVDGNNLLTTNLE